jgi:hypothetical protein
MNIENFKSAVYSNKRRLAVPNNRHDNESLPLMKEFHNIGNKASTVDVRVI